MRRKIITTKKKQIVKCQVTFVRDNGFSFSPFASSTIGSGPEADEEEDDDDDDEDERDLILMPEEPAASTSAAAEISFEAPPRPRDFLWPSRHQCLATIFTNDLVACEDVTNASVVTF
jgi:hypothetical protein